MVTSKIKLELNETLYRAKEKEKNLLYFINASYIMEFISRILILDKKKKKPLDNKYEISLDDLIKSINELNKIDKNILDFQNELSYKSYYQIFEEYINGIFTVLFIHFPKFLRNEKFDLEFDLIFEQENIQMIRDKIIEKRVKKYIQSNNILEILKKFESIFGIDISLNKIDRDKLFLASKIRNILTHNNGIINDIFLDEIMLKNISTKYKLNESIFPSLNKELEQIEDDLIGIIIKIHDQIIKKLIQLKNYHDSK